MKKNTLAALGCVIAALASSTLQAQAPPPPGGQFPPLPPPQQPQPNFGRCFEIVVQNQGVAVDLRAVATDPYTITLTWSGFAGVYDITHIGAGAPFGGQVMLGPPVTLKREPTYGAAPRPTQPATTPQLYPGTLTHAQAAAGSQHNYTIIGTLADGRKACGVATTNTPPAPPAPEAPARTRPIGPPPVQTVATLTVVTANQSNAFALGGNIGWEMKMDRLAGHIAASGQVPDIISMTESSGWTNCSSPASDNSGHYDLVDRLIANLRNRLSVTYRVAYLVGQEGSFGPLDRCHYYTGDTVLYNPNRITNLTPSDVAGRPQELHDSRFLGFHVRKSLPICSRGARTSIPNLEQLIDGPPQIDRCNRETPSAPVWAWQELMPDRSLGVVATLARFGLVGVPGSSFDVVTAHPTSMFELTQHAAISNFIAGLTNPPFRTTRPYYPTIVLGDFNCLIGPGPYDTCPGNSPKPTAPWPTGTTQVFTVPEEVMAVALGNGGGTLPPLRNLTVNVGATLPAPRPCRPNKDETGMDFFADRSFSDHCGLIVRLSE